MEKVLSHKDIETLLEEYDGDDKKGSNSGNEYAIKNLDLILDVPLEISVVLGKAKKTIKDITNVVPGSIIELDKPVDEPLEIYANGKKIAEGEAVVINEKFSVRITKIVSKKELFKNL